MNLCKKYFIFDEDYKNDGEYALFRHDLTNYTKEDQDNQNKHRKDAIDVLCSAASNYET